MMNMRRCKFYVFLLLVFSIGILDRLVGQETLHAPRGSVKVDGRVDDAWKLAKPIEVKKFVKEFTTIEDENCPTAKVRCLWDDHRLYVLADVKDSVISTRNGNAWAQDSLEIFVDSDLSRSKCLGDSDYQFRLSAIGEVTTGAAARAKHIYSKVVPMTGGYRVEAAFEFCKGMLKPNAKMGLEFQINNDPGTGQRESITKWNHPGNDSWQNSSNYGTLVLEASESEEESVPDRKTIAQTFTVSYSEALSDESKSVPDWAADAVFYQIFPERFRNGDKSNDPTRESLEFPDVVPATWRVTPWTDQWYRRSEWELAMGHSFYEDGVFHRRYGGDLQGVIDKLDYLHDLGINAIYFNPVFYARSLHKYDGNSFHHIDPHFGPDPKGDFAIIATETADPSTWKWTAADKLFLDLLKRAKKRNIRVIIDGVFNHTGRDFFAFRDIVRRQEKSPYVDWYMIERFDDPKTPENEFKYKGWWGVATLPEFANNKADDDLHPHPKAYVMKATARWMDPNGDGNPNDGIDGWRLDVANEVPNKFWREWNDLVRKLNPDAYTVAEIWGNAGEYLEDCGFSATMNYHGFAFLSKGFLIDGRLSASDFGTMIEQRMNEHEPSVRFALQNLLDSHDTDRVASMIVNSRQRKKYLNASRFDYDVGERASPRHAKQYDVSAPTPIDKRLLRLVALFQMTYVGAPMVYYGTECGMDGADDPDDRMPMVWSDLEYESRTIGPIGKLDAEFPIRFDQELFDYYKKLIKLRTANPALCRGSFALLQTDDKSGLFVFLREFKEEKFVVAINRGDKDVQIDLSGIDVEPVQLVRLIDSSGDENVATIASRLEVSSKSKLNIKRLSGQIWQVKN